MKKVIIGIISKHLDDKLIRPNTYIRDELKDAIYSNGAIPIGILPPNQIIDYVNNEDEKEKFLKLDNLLSKKEEQNFKDAISLCDGIILAGGVYADSYEMWVSKFCFKHNIPLLAICLGQNNVVRSLGGTTKLVQNQKKHLQKYATYVHDIDIKKNSLFYKIVKTTKMKVNSRHIYTVDNYADLVPSAYDDDGNIEVLEAPNKTFFLSVRFHPETLYKTDQKHNAIFKHFIKVCKNKL